MGARRKFDEDFKQRAVRQVRATGKPIAQVARELGVNEGTLGDWCPRTGAGTATERRRASGKSRSSGVRRTPSCGCGAMCSSAALPSGPRMR
jgi:transposase